MLFVLYGSSAVIQYDSGSVVRSDLLGSVKASLDSMGIGHVELGGAVMNPELTMILLGYETQAEYALV